MLKKKMTADTLKYNRVIRRKWSEGKRDIDRVIHAGRQTEKQREAETENLRHRVW